MHTHDCQRSKDEEIKKEKKTIGVVSIEIYTGNPWQLEKEENCTRKGRTKKKQNRESVTH